MSIEFFSLGKTDSNYVWQSGPEPEQPSGYVSQRFLDINGVATTPPADSTESTEQPKLGEDDSYEYGRPATDLWGPDGSGTPQIDDAVQGQLADCYAVASMGATAAASPDVIRDNIVDNGDGTYTVTFYEKSGGIFGIGDSYKPVEIIVDDQVPVDEVGDPVYARESGDGENWVMIYEKAYAEFIGGSYESIEWDKAETALEAINGKDFERQNPDDMSDAELTEKLKNGPVTVSTVSQGDEDKTIATFGDEDLVARHVYVVKRVFEVDGETYVELHNPWGRSHPTLTLDQIREVSDRITAPN